MEHATAIIAGMALAFSVATTVLGLMLKYAISDIELKLTRAIIAARREIDDRIDSQARDFGETVAAIRQKITDVEMWARDNFARRDSFYKITDDLSSKIDSVGEKIEDRLERMEGKIDTRLRGAE